ncbi:hypothetical protein AeRB84_009178, partial [Aphanomyces euteiches]
IEVCEMCKLHGHALVLLLGHTLAQYSFPLIGIAHGRNGHFHASMALCMDTLVAYSFQLSLRFLDRVVNQSKNVTYEAAKANVIKSFKSADDEDVVTVCSVLSVRCPLGLGLIDLPVRGINCAHLQCFDLKTFLVFQESARSQAWTCIVCDKWIHLSELRIDPFWKQLLHDVAHDDELELVEIFPDATWKKHTPIDKREKKPKIPMISGGAARSRLVSTDAVDLTLWSDDDEHPVK